MANRFKVGDTVRFKDNDDAGYPGSRRGQNYLVKGVQPDSVFGSLVLASSLVDGNTINVLSSRFEPVESATEVSNIELDTLLRDANAGIAALNQLEKKYASSIEYSSLGNSDGRQPPRGGYLP